MYPSFVLAYWSFLEKNYHEFSLKNFIEKSRSKCQINPTKCRLCTCRTKTISNKMFSFRFSYDHWRFKQLKHVIPTRNIPTVLEYVGIFPPKFSHHLLRSRLLRIIKSSIIIMMPSSSVQVVLASVLPMVYQQQVSKLL